MPIYQIFWIFDQFFIFWLLGTPALTSRNFKEQDFATVVDMVETGVQISLAAQEKSGIKMLKYYRSKNAWFLSVMKLSS